MNFINKQVSHKHFGKGNILEISDSCIEIQFSSGNKKFVFPDAFESYLTMIDKKAAASINKMREEREEERKKEEMELEKERALKREEMLHLLHREKLLRNLKIHASSQAAFWCDEEEQSRAFKDWRVTTGFIKSGAKKGQIASMNRLNKNSTCVFTSRDAGIPEKERRILGMYMVNEDFIGKLCKDGIISAHPEYRVVLSPEESEKMLFWNYYRNDKYPGRMTWNAGKYRYLDNVWSAQILQDIISLKKDPKEKELLEQFLEYYCDLNRLDRNELPKPDGELLRV